MTEPSEERARQRIREQFAAHFARLTDELAEQPMEKLLVFMDDKASLLLGPRSAMLVPLPMDEVNALAEQRVSEQLDPAPFPGMYL